MAGEGVRPYGDDGRDDWLGWSHQDEPPVDSEAPLLPSAGGLLPAGGRATLLRRQRAPVALMFGVHGPNVCALEFSKVFKVFTFSRKFQGFQCLQEARYSSNNTGTTSDVICEVCTGFYDFTARKRQPDSVGPDAVHPQTYPGAIRAESNGRGHR